MAGMNYCKACDVTFGSIGAFDMHRTGSYGDAIYASGDTKRKKPIGHTEPSRRCMTLDEINAAGMVQNGKGWWITGGFSGFGAEEE
jgi:hypothetical protein